MRSISRLILLMTLTIFTRSPSTFRNPRQALHFPSSNRFSYQFRNTTIKWVERTRDFYHKLRIISSSLFASMPNTCSTVFFSPSPSYSSPLTQAYPQFKVVTGKRAGVCQDATLLPTRANVGITPKIPPSIAIAPRYNRFFFRAHY